MIDLLIVGTFIITEILDIYGLHLSLAGVETPALKIKSSSAENR